MKTTVQERIVEWSCDRCGYTTTNGEGWIRLMAVDPALFPVPIFDADLRRDAWDVCSNCMSGFDAWFTFSQQFTL